MEGEFFGKGLLFGWMGGGWLLAFYFRKILHKN